jgi:hypothetical protein
MGDLAAVCLGLRGSGGQSTVPVNWRRSTHPKPPGNRAAHCQLSQPPIQARQVQGGAPGGQPVHTPKLTAILKTKVEDASQVQEKNMKALNQAKQAGASLQKILDETPGDVKDRLPNDFPPTARMKPAVKLHSGVGMPLSLYPGQRLQRVEYSRFRRVSASQVLGLHYPHRTPD